MKLVAFCGLGLVVSGIALFSVQNAAPVALQFLLGRTIDLPLGFVLSAAFAVGLLLSALMPWLWAMTKP